MKRTLLVTIFTLSTLFAFSQDNPDGSESLFFSPYKTEFLQPNISIYPNPATNYISIDNDESVKSIVVFDLVGRKLKTFKDIRKNEQYDISTLPNGMYLVQVTDTSNKILTTQRISKR